MDIRAANKGYERWLAVQLKGDIVADDLKKKHKAMCDNAFSFLRATYWRWAETILDICTDLANAPAVLAVGDIHLENFGTWIDKEARIVWGVNDYDEAAEMPYLLDLVRLATSAALAATPRQISLKAICASVLEGYAYGIEAPEAFVLDRQHMWLRKRFVVDEAARAKFWQKIDDQYRNRLAEEKSRAAPVALAQAVCRRPARCLHQLDLLAAHGGHRQPRPPALARLRPLARRPAAARRQGAGAVRLDTGAWWRHAPLSQRHRLRQISRARPVVRGEREPADPAIVAEQPKNQRRGPPRRRPPAASRPALGMGRDLAAIHLGARDRRDALRKDLEKRKRRWFRTHVESAAEFVAREYAEWKKSAK